MNRKQRFKTAFILGAGLGMRLRPLTEHCPKPLLDVAGRPVITYAMDRLIDAGIERFIINTHHCPKVYAEKFPDRQWKGRPLIFRHEPALLDTAGGLKNIEDLLEDDQSILCYNGDVFAGISLRRLILDHQQHEAEATLALRRRGPLLNVNIDDSGAICDIRNTFNVPGKQSCLFTGIYALETSILQHIPVNKPETIIATFLQRIAAHPGSIRGLLLDDGEWTDIGSIETYEQLNHSFTNQEDSWIQRKN